MAIQLNFTDKIISITTPTTTVTVQELVDVIREEEDELYNLTYKKVIDAVGKSDLGGGVTTGIVMTLNSDWQIQFYGGSGYTVVKGGTLVGGVGDKPIKATGTANDITVQVQPTDATITTANVTEVEDKVDRILTATEIKQCIITDASPSSLSFTTNLTETSNQFWQRGVILITSGNNTGQMRAILNYNGSTKAVTLKTPLDTAPAQNDTFIILTERKYLTPDVEDIIGAVWDEPIADHLVDGSTGDTLDFLKNIEGGKWAIVGTEMIFYKADNVTEICKFSLFDKNGVPSGDNVFKRERV